MNRCADYIAHYEADAEHFDYFNNPDETVHYYEILFRKFIRRVAGRSIAVLDIGSGSGWTKELTHEQIFFVDLARKNLLALKPNSTGAVLADACYLPFKTGSVESVIASEIVEHINYPESAAREILRVLRKGGKAIVSTPYKERIRYALCIHCNQVTPMNAHLHSFDKASLLSLFPNTRRKSYLFGSKVLVILRSTRLFYRLPIFFWRLVDRPLTSLLDKAQHIVIVVEK